MSADLNDQFVTRCRQCGSVVPVSVAVNNRQNNPFLQRDICNQCASQLAGFQKIGLLVLAICLSIALLLGLAFIAYAVFVLFMK